jgi:acetyl esterase/lipase
MLTLRRVAAIGLVAVSGMAACAQRATVAATSRPVTTAAPATREATTKPDQTPRAAADSVIQKDVAYVPDASAQQKLDIYAPVKAQGAPVVIFVHGGEWTKGDKTEVSFKPKFLNEAGIVFVSINYRLSGEARHPAQVEDVASAVRWVRAHIAEHGGDPHKLVLMGHSAGCHLVTLVGLDPRPLAKVGLKPSDLSGVVSWSGGAFDLVAKVAAGGMYADYIHKNFGDDEQVWRDASPLAHIGDGKPMPPFLFASAEEGNPASREISERMVARIEKAGGKARATLLAGKTHAAANHEVGQPGDVTGAELVRFVREVTADKTAKP